MSVITSVYDEIKFTKENNNFTGNSRSFMLRQFCELRGMENLYAVLPIILIMSRISAETSRLS